MTEAALLPYDPQIRFHNCTASDQKPGNLKKQSRLSLELKPLFCVFYKDRGSHFPWLFPRPARHRIEYLF